MTDTLTATTPTTPAPPPPGGVVVSEAPAPVDKAPAAPPAPPEGLNEREAADWRLDSELAATFRKLNPDRDADGRFTAKDDETTATEAAPPEGQDAPVETKPEGQTPEAESKEPVPVPAIPAPASWPAEMKAKWDALPSDAREFIAKREQDAHAAISRLGSQAKAFEPLGKVIEQHAETFQRSNVHPVDGIARLLAAQEAMDRDPAAAIKHFAGVYGVDLASLALGIDPPSQPQNAALERTIADLRRELAETKSGLNEVRTRDASIRQAAVSKTIEDFAKGKPDWADVENDVADLLPVFRERMPDDAPEKVLQAAYDAALKLNPAVSARIAAREAAARAEAAKKEEAKRAEQARKAAAINVRGSVANGATARSMDDTLREAYRAAQRR